MSYIDDQVKTLMRMIATYADTAYNAGIMAHEAGGIGRVTQRMADLQHWQKSVEEAIRLVVVDLGGPDAEEQPS